ncbi:MAG: MFS transporter, partial [Proteobacteria bacterium]|nr:MFS transporter [Pseudomonadota bacterium]
IPLVMDISLSPLMLSILFFCLGFFTSTQVISYPLIAESNPVQNIGTATGFASLLIMGGAGIGQLLFGWLMRYHAGLVEQYNVADFQFAMWIFPLTVGVALVAIFFTRETYCRPLN